MSITDLVQDWFKKEARDLPWRVNKSPYRVWVSEIMLQQTQVAKVVGYFNRFMARFKSIEELALASEDEVLSYWAGLGYYSRCRNLHKAAKQILRDHAGVFPSGSTSIAALPGVGTYTAGAIRSFAFNQVAPVVDGNIARVLSRLYADATDVQTPKGKKHFEALSLQLAQRATQPAVFHEGIMELGATVCKPRSPACGSCPIATLCAAHLKGREHEFPTKVKRLVRKELHAVFAILGDKEHVWLERNEDSRLFGKLYAPPHIMLADPAHEESALSRLAHEIGFKTAHAKFSVTRQLTHRIFHMHGYVVKASPMNMPQGKWIKRSELNCVGLSSAVKALLQKAGLFCLILFGSSCATHTTIARNLPIDQKALPGPDEEVADDEQVNIDDEALRGALIVAALDAVGSRQIRVDGSIFRRDCSGTVRGIFAKAGLTLRDAKALRGYSDSQSLMDYIEEIGEIKHESPRPGDLVFFKETYNVKRNHENISHVGVVTRVSDEDVHYVHFSSGRIIESSMGDQLRRRRRGVKAKTGTELFAGYGELDLNAVKYVL